MKVVILSNVQHDQKQLHPSSKPVDLDAEVARDLVKGGAACLPGDPRAAALADAETEADAREKATEKAEKEAREAASKAAADAAAAASKT